MPQKKTRGAIWVYFAVANLAFVVVVVIIIVAAWPRGRSTEPTSTADAQKEQPDEGKTPGPTAEIVSVDRPAQLTVAEVVAAVKPAVVILKTYNSQKQQFGFGLSSSSVRSKKSRK